jgi:glycosyltransferase involved in cell wall biosynthesis
VIVPSEWYENAPISILESFAYGKPVIGARIGGIPEMINDDENGYLFDSGNGDDLKEKLNLLQNISANKIMEMGKAAREKMEKLYNASFHYDKLMSVYRAALNQ